VHLALKLTIFVVVDINTLLVFPKVDGSPIKQFSNVLSLVHIPIKISFPWFDTALLVKLRFEAQP